MSQDKPLPQTMKEAECDLVMKGGITSGIVYPRAIYKLAQHYRFRCIGGTSAGAIAAAAAAAAELGRQRDKHPDVSANRPPGEETGTKVAGPTGFEALKSISDALAQDQNLLKLFQPYEETAPLCRTLLYLSEQGLFKWNTPVPPSSDPPGTQQPSIQEQAPASGTMHDSPPALPSPRLLQLANRFFRVPPAVQWGVRFWEGLLRGLATYDQPRFGAGRAQGQAAGTVLGLGVGALSGAWFGVIFTLGMAFGEAPGALELVTGAAIVLVGGAVLGSLGGRWLGARVGGPLKSLRGIARMVWTKVPEQHFFGLCGGLTVDQKGHSESAPVSHQLGFTDWLHQSLNQMAGLDPNGPPLTFGQLRAHQIQLRMLTSNLSHGQPYELPFPVQRFLFRKSEMCKLFPSIVVEHMITPPLRGDLDLSGLEDYYLFPPADELPVVVAVRMSLSFPLLLSAIPLHTIDRAVFAGNPPPYRPNKCDLQLNWFSDGGLCSNFPIHFFDAWMPGRPTFGINLTTANAEAQQTGDGQPGLLSERHYSQTGLTTDAVAASARLSPVDPCATQPAYLREASDPLGSALEWQTVDGLVGFGRIMLHTAQNYRDNQQARLPGYRERIAQIRLHPSQGGLNLAMDRKTIQTMQDYGTQAAEQILTKFKFDQHQWIRMRVLLDQLEERLYDAKEELQESYLEDLFNKQMDARQGGMPYPDDCDETWRQQAWERLYPLVQMVAEWAKLRPGDPLPEDYDEFAGFFTRAETEPRPELRVTARS
jgi:predicted acylesterase/phospholipase RssA